MSIGVMTPYFFSLGISKQFVYYEVGLSSLHPTSSSSGGTVSCFFVRFLTANLPVWDALPKPTLSPVKLGGALQHLSPATIRQGPTPWRSFNCIGALSELLASGRLA